MSLFGGLDLFGSGGHRFTVGGVGLRHVVHETPGGRGVRLSALGKTGRLIEQAGDLLADDPDRMRGLTGAIEGMLDGVARVLVDDVGQSWDDVVMVKFEPGAVVPAGLRWRVRYRIEYLQTVV